jgi:hypothetical protein
MEVELTGLGFANADLHLRSSSITSYLLVISEILLPQLTLTAKSDLLILPFGDAAETTIVNFETAKKA